MFKQSRTKLTRWILVPVLAVVATGFGYRAVAVAIESRPPTVAVVFNLQLVFDSFVERAVLGAEYKQLEANIDAERMVRKATVENLITAYDEAGDEDKELLFDQIQQAMGEAEKYIEFTEREKDVEKSLIMQTLFRDIKSAVAKIAEANNYDLVIASDASIELNPKLPSRATNEQISMHRIYYANNQIDITEQIITQMNLELELKTN
ncbi:MAG: OmpH family outer membrane protein [Planctomycetes bacterium]|nr:OmpH family outer membrane protein [Planctomycetota bacterium]